MFDLAEELHKNPELKEDDIENIKSWIAKQPHLPKVPGTVNKYTYIYTTRIYRQ